MSTILLDERQLSIVNQSQSAIQVRDPAGNLLGKIVRSTVPDERWNTEHWIQCWEEWYFGEDGAESD